MTLKIFHLFFGLKVNYKIKYWHIWELTGYLNPIKDGARFKKNLLRVVLASALASKFSWSRVSLKWIFWKFHSILESPYSIFYAQTTCRLWNTVRICLQRLTMTQIEVFMICDRLLGNDKVYISAATPARKRFHPQIYYVELVCL